MVSLLMKIFYIRNSIQEVCMHFSSFFYLLSLAFVSIFGTSYPCQAPEKYSAYYIVHDEKAHELFASDPSHYEWMVPDFLSAEHFFPRFMALTPVQQQEWARNVTKY